MSYFVSIDKKDAFRHWSKKIFKMCDLRKWRLFNDDLFWRIHIKLTVRPNVVLFYFDQSQERIESVSFYCELWFSRASCEIHWLFFLLFYFGHWIHWLSWTYEQWKHIKMMRNRNEILSRRRLEISLYLWFVILMEMGIESLIMSMSTITSTSKYNLK